MSASPWPTAAGRVRSAEHTLRANPTDPDANAELRQLAVWGHADLIDPELLARADQLEEPCEE